MSHRMRMHGIAVDNWKIGERRRRRRRRRRRLWCLRRRRRTFLTETSKVVINFKKFKTIVVSIVNYNVLFYCLGQSIQVGVRREIKVGRIFERIFEIKHCVSDFSLLLWSRFETRQIRVFVNQCEGKKIFGINFLGSFNRIATGQKRLGKSNFSIFCQILTF